jgi:WD40 repeat protein
LPLIKITEHIRVHADVVRQIGYYERINSFISAAQCPDTAATTPNKRSLKCAGLIVGNMGIQKSMNTFHVNRGMNCFAFDEKSSLLATGGPDTILRLWSPEVTQKPKAILIGHHAGINFIFIQDGGKLVYSLDKLKVSLISFF